MGRGEPVPTDELEVAKEIYLARHANARHWVDYQDFGCYRLEVVDVYFVGDFGVMGWVDAADYAAAPPDPLVDAASGILEHMNEDHGDACCCSPQSTAGSTRRRR